MNINNAKFTQILNAMNNFDLIIIGGGAAGYFAAINVAENNPNLKILILERGKDVLSKVKISGGGRCNVTHAEFDPQELVKNYPRGEKELLGPFHRFMTGDTIKWFEGKGIVLKIEEDGRMFPESNSSQTIIDCFEKEVNRYGIKVLKEHAVRHIQQLDQNWIISTQQQDFSSKKLLIASGSSKKMWKMIQQIGHKIVHPVPSLFTFNIRDDRIKNIPGIVAQDVEIKVVDSHLISEGPLLITHVGMSAPAILKLSAFGALEFAKLNYQFKIVVNFVKLSFEECRLILKNLKKNSSKKNVLKHTQFQLPKRLWQSLVEATAIPKESRWADLNKMQIEVLTSQLTNAVFEVEGKSTFKEEFVTSGGVDLKEIDFKTFESKIHKNLYFAGEVLNIDAVTGGFNFQNAWTGAYIAAQNIAN